MLIFQLPYTDLFQWNCKSIRKEKCWGKPAFLNLRTETLFSSWCLLHRKIRKWECSTFHMITLLSVTFPPWSEIRSFPKCTKAQPWPSICQLFRANEDKNSSCSRNGQNRNLRTYGLGFMSPKFRLLKIWIYNLSKLFRLSVASTKENQHLQRQVSPDSQVDESLVEVPNSLEIQPTWLNQTKYLLVIWLKTGGMKPPLSEIAVVLTINFLLC